MAATIKGKQGPLQVFSPDFGQTIEVDQIDRPAHATDEQLTAQTIAICRRAVLRSAADARVIGAVRQALTEAQAQPTDPARTLADAVFWFSKTHIIYTPEVTLEAPFLPNLELDTQLDQALTEPPDLLQMQPAMKGDCPDFSMLVAAMLRVLGISSQFKTIAADPRQPQTFSHIYVVANTPEGPYPLDASNGPEPGVEYATPTKTKTWPIDMPIRPQRNRLRGLGDVFTDSIDQTVFGIDPSVINDVYTPTATATISPSWATAVSTIANDVSSIAKPILTNRFSTPTVAPGTYYQTRNADGSVTTAYGQPVGSTSLNLPGIGTTSSSSLLLYGGAALVLVLLLKR